MLRLFVFILLTSAGLEASAMTSVNCMLGTVTQSSTDASSSGCYLSVPQPPPSTDYSFVSGLATTSDSLIGGTQLAISALTQQVAYTTGGPRPNLPVAVRATALDTLHLATGGPFRPGEIDYRVLFDSLNQNSSPGAASALISDGIHSYSGGSPSPGVFGGAPPLPNCTPANCEYSQIAAPFNLGVPFLATAEGNTSLSANLNQLDFGQLAQGGALISINLFESDGITPVPILIGPEPGTFGFLLFGLVAASGAVSLRRKG